jgi:hypothetical protein
MNCGYLINLEHFLDNYLTIMERNLYCINALGCPVAVYKYITFLTSLNLEKSINTEN